MRYFPPAITIENDHPNKDKCANTPGVPALAYPTKIGD
jgi:hypothetical protein